jgi:signal transduction histidine kinase
MNVTRESWTNPGVSVGSSSMRASALPRAYAGSTLVTSVALVAVYVALAAIASLLPHEAVPAPPWSPQTGLAIAAVAVGGYRLVPAVVIAAVVGESALNGESSLFGWVDGAMLGSIYAAMALLLRSRAEGTPSLMRMQVLRDFLLVVFVGTALAAAIHAGLYVADAGSTHGALQGMLNRWLGDLTGAAIVAPLLISLTDVRARRAFGQHAGLDVALVSAALLGLFALTLALDPVEGHKIFYLAFVPLVYVAVRHGFTGAVIATAATQLALVVALYIGDRSPIAVAEYQMMMLVLAVTTLLLGSVAYERRRALADLARHAAELRTQQWALSDAMRVAAASETAATLAHEMSQPVSAIGTYARAGSQMLRQGQDRHDDLVGILERIERETQRSSDTLRRIRDFFRNGIIRREPVDVGALVSAAIEAVHDRIGFEGIQITTDIPTSLPPVSAARVQIGTVLHILLGNAIDALSDTPAPRRIRVAARDAGDEVEFEVENSGPGIPAVVVERLFEPLATTKPSGIGLGLVISRTIVESHGGRLWLAAPQPTSFRFTLPTHGKDD